MTQHVKYSGLGTDKEISINIAFPTVTLAEVQLLNPSATLSDTADWYVLQKLIYDATVYKNTRLYFPQGKFRISKPINFTQKMGIGWFVEGTGCTLKAATDYGGEMVILSRGNNYGTCRNGRIKGLAIDGNYTAEIGFKINDALEWFLDNVRIYRCFVGIQLSDTYYGEISGECVIQDCLSGIKTVPGGSDEVNTIEFNNVKINFSPVKTIFIPKNDGENDESYNIRVKSIGVELTTKIMGCKFRGLTLEGMDYGFYGTKSGVKDSSNTSIFQIQDCYFESIKKEAGRLISFEIPDGFANHYFSVSLVGNRFVGNPIFSIGQGTWRVYGNEKDSFKLKIVHNGSYRTMLSSDLSSDKIISQNENIVTFIKKDYIPWSANANKYNDYGNPSTYPDKKTMLPTINDYHGLEYMPRLRNGERASSPYVLGVHTKPLTFAGNEHPAAPVIKGENGKYYMITTKDGIGLVLKEVTNMFFLEPPVNSKSAKELWSRESSEGDSFFCIELQCLVVFTNGKWIAGKGTDSEVHAIGKGLNLASASPVNTAKWNWPFVWNVQINHGYVWQGSYWAWGNNVLGTGRINIRAVGTLAQRPVMPNIEEFIYYSTDKDKYYKWDTASSSYLTYTPFF